MSDEQHTPSIVDELSSLTLRVHARSVYVAAPFTRKFEAAQVAAMLTRCGWRVTSSWHTDRTAPAETREFEGDLPQPGKLSIALTCVAEVTDASCVVLLGGATCRGALFEAGVATGQGKPVYWVGDRSVTLFSALSS